MKQVIYEGSWDLTPWYLFWRPKYRRIIFCGSPLISRTFVTEYEYSNKMKERTI